MCWACAHLFNSCQSTFAMTSQFLVHAHLLWRQGAGARCQSNWRKWRHQFLRDVISSDRCAWQVRFDWLTWEHSTNRNTFFKWIYRTYRMTLFVLCKIGYHFDITQRRYFFLEISYNKIKLRKFFSAESDMWNRRKEPQPDAKVHHISFNYCSLQGKFACFIYRKWLRSCTSPVSIDSFVTNSIKHWELAMSKLWDNHMLEILCPPQTW